MRCLTMFIHLRRLSYRNPTLKDDNDSFVKTNRLYRFRTELSNVHRFDATARLQKKKIFVSEATVSASVELVFISRHGLSTENNLLCKAFWRALRIKAGFVWFEIKEEL